MEKIYIAGKIGDLPKEVYEFNFSVGEINGARMGYESISPLNLPHNHGKSWKEYMSEDLKALKGCEAIYMLTNWTDSRGARIEHWFAKRYGKKVYYQNIHDNGRG